MTATPPRAAILFFRDRIQIHVGFIDMSTHYHLMHLKVSARRHSGEPALDRDAENFYALTFGGRFSWRKNV